MLGFRLGTTLLIASILLGCSASYRRDTAVANDPSADVAAMMQGHYDSRDQAAKDASYYPLSLSMVPIWDSRSDGHWLYVDHWCLCIRQAVYGRRRALTGLVRVT